MRIKKLELHGFKSFKDRTVIHFDQGITGIVGPNGCGKSNIVDALVWVMGEMSAKHLRGSNMSDVIFAGAEGYAPVGMAEVSLTLENDGGPFPAKYNKFSEVMVTRRLHRSGESEYLINKEPARLRDVQEIFMDTGAGAKGFSIVEQGAIGKIITAKPEDRRSLIEEAAGITKFKVRKRESQRKLESTDQNLVRLQDILGEQKRHLDSLQRQAQRAERYRGLKREAQEKELFVAAKNYLSFHSESQAAEQLFQLAKESEATCASEADRFGSDLEAKRLERLENERRVEAAQVVQSQALQDVQRLEREVRELQFEIEQARRTEEMTGNIRQQYEARQSALTAQREELGQKHQDVAARAEASKAQLSEKSAQLADVRARIQSADEQLTLKRKEMLTIGQSESTLAAKQTVLQDRLSALQEKLESARLVLAELTAKRSEFEKRHSRLVNELEGERQLQLDIMKDVDNFAENLKILEQQTLERRGAVEEFKDQLNQVSSRLYGLEELQANFEGFEEGVRKVMLWQRQRQSPSLQSVMHADGRVTQEVSGSEDSDFRPVAEVIEVSAEYELAMEAALGSRLQLLVSRSSDSALSAVDYLKESKQGRSSFVSADWLSGAQTPADDAKTRVLNEPGVEAWFSDLVSIPEQFAQPVSQFLSGVVLVDRVATALRLRPNYPGLSFVTRDGDLLSSEGILTGGSAEQAESGVLKRRREIKELSLQREEWAGKLALAQAALKKTEAQLKTVSEELTASKQRQSEKEMAILSLQKDVEFAEAELANARRALDRQQQDVSRDEAQNLQLQDEMSEVEARLIELRERRLLLEGEVAVLDQEFHAARQGVDELQSTVSRLEVDTASLSKEAEGLKWQLEMVDKSLAEVTDQLGKMSEESERTAVTLSSNQLALEERRVQFEQRAREAEEAQRLLAEVTNQFELVDQTVRELEDSASSAMRRLSELRTQMSEAQLKSEQLKLKEQYLRDQIFERYTIELPEVAPNYAAMEGDLATIEAELNELKEKLSKIGEVNLSAIQEYDELVSRFEFLNKQFQDLTDAKEQLRKVIDRINRICSRRFKETFELVNERFTKVFPVLFGGGEARLILVEDPEKDEAGIDIVARPPGKKLQNVSLLSGGEKALTAVSLIFSIFLVKPSPFCLLDEVDAPLDDANVARFNDLVKEMAKRSQIIVVTHNKYTMRVNNKLYGVTMQEKGVSKMVSVSLEEAQKVIDAAGR